MTNTYTRRVVNTPHPLRACCSCLVHVGLKPRAIGRILHRAPAQAMKWAVAAGYQNNGRRQFPKHFLCATCLYLVGFGVTRIGKAMRCNKGSVQKWLVKLSIYKPPENPSAKAGAVVRRMAKINWGSPAVFRAAKKERPVKLAKPKPLWFIGGRFSPRLYYAHHRERILADQRRRLRDPQKRMIRAIRHRTWCVIKSQNGLKRHSLTKELLGCSRDQLLEHLRAQFTPGMSWANYGQWEIDHIIPCSSFDLTQPEQQRRCFHFTNLQPLWKSDNRKKWATVPKHQPELTLNAA